jgi:hypothetical protein
MTSLPAAGQSSVYEREATVADHDAGLARMRASIRVKNLRRQSSLSPAWG